MSLNFFKKWLFPKKVNWTVIPEYQKTSLGKMIKTLDDAYHLDGEFVDGKVFKINVENKNYYLKKYDRFKRFIPRHFSFSKVKMEWKNLLWFQSMNIPVAKVIAYGQETQGRVVQRGALITEELINCFDLVHIEAHKPELLEDRRWLKLVSHQVAEVTRIMHQNSFAHNDLKWRNIMVDLKADSPKIYLIDCPAGMKWPWPFLSYRIIKDLACLDKRAKYKLSQTQRLAFYKDYVQCDKLTEKHKKQIRKILSFFHNRE